MDVVVVWVWLTILLRILQTVTAYFLPLSQGHQQSQAVFGHALMYTIHTHYTPAVAEVVLLELLIHTCISSSVFCWRKTSSCWRFSASLRHRVAAEGEEWVRGGRSTLALEFRSYAIIQRLWNSRLSTHW